MPIKLSFIYDKNYLCLFVFFLKIEFQYFIISSYVFYDLMNSFNYSRDYIE